MEFSLVKGMVKCASRFFRPINQLIDQSVSQSVSQCPPRRFLSLPSRSGIASTIEQTASAHVSYSKLPSPPPLTIQAT